MNRDIRTILLTRSVREAAQIMIDTGLRRLPVVDGNGVLVGIVGRADLLQVIVTSPLMSVETSSATQPLSLSGSLSPEALQQRPIAAYSTPASSTVYEQTLLDEVIDALQISPLKRVIVVNQERQIQGIISDVDVLAHIHDEMRPRLLTLLTGWARGRPRRPKTDALRPSFGKDAIAAEIMNREVVMVSETTSVQETIEKMIATRRKILPVVNAQHQLTGVVGRSDLLRVLIEQ